MNPEISPLALQLVAMFVLLLANGFFVSVEFAYVTVPRPRIDQLAAKGDPRASRVRDLLANTDRVLAASQLGITMASLGLGWIGENAANQLLRLAFTFVPPPFETAIANTIGLAIAFGLVTALHIVLGEQSPKIIAIRAADRFALSSARAVALFDFALRPFVALLDNATAGVVRLFGVEPIGAHQTIYSVDELKQLVSETHESGELTAHEKEMIHNVFEFGDKLVREVMTPRPGMVTVEEHTTIAEFLQTFREAIHARFPIYANSIDNIIGFLGIKDVLRVIAENGANALDQSVGPLTRPAFFVPESKRVGKLFAEMQAKNIQIAIVIDEFGGTAGMVTLEELTHQIVGHLGDELGQERPLVETIDEHTVQIDAQMRVQEINEQLGVGLPEREDYETMAGFILYALRHIPKEGEQFRTGNWRITVTRMDGPKIEKVLLTRL